MSAATPATHPTEGPDQGELAKHIEALRNAVNGVGPLNFLPADWPADEIAVLNEATLIVSRVIAAYKSA